MTFKIFLKEPLRSSNPGDCSTPEVYYLNCYPLPTSSCLVNRLYDPDVAQSLFPRHQQGITLHYGLCIIVHLSGLLPGYLIYVIDLSQWTNCSNPGITLVRGYLNFSFLTYDIKMIDVLSKTCFDIRQHSSWKFKGGHRGFIQTVFVNLRSPS